MRMGWRGGLFGIGLDMSETGPTLNHAAFPVGVASGERGDLVEEILIDKYFADPLLAALVVSISL